jgi:FtsZ-binding cell division protein ZapB
MSPPTRTIRLNRRLHTKPRKPPLAYRPSDQAKGETEVMASQEPFHFHCPPETEYYCHAHGPLGDLHEAVGQARIEASILQAERDDLRKQVGELAAENQRLREERDALAMRVRYLTRTL